MLTSPYRIRCSVRFSATPGRSGYGAAAARRRTQDVSGPCTDESLAGYRPWFYAAAVYNAVWGSLNILFPSLLFDLLDMEGPNYGPLWQVVGMFVLVYAPAYGWAGRRPARHRHFVVIGLLGKLLGPLGFVWALANDDIPQVFGWTILTNDLIWWPAFGLYLREVARRCGGWRALLLGD